MVNGVSLEPVEFKEAVFNGHVAHKVEGFHGPHSTDSILFFRQVPGLRSPQKQEKEGRGLRSLMTARSLRSSKARPSNHVSENYFFFSRTEMPPNTGMEDFTPKSML